MGARRALPSQTPKLRGKAITFYGGDELDSGSGARAAGECFRKIVQMSS